MLPPIGLDGDTREYTLVLDLDETLVHYIMARKSYLVRPGCRIFLADLAKYYQIVLEPASTKEISAKDIRERFNSITIDENLTDDKDIKKENLQPTIKKSRERRCIDLGQGEARHRDCAARRTLGWRG